MAIIVLPELLFAQHSYENRMQWQRMQSKLKSIGLLEQEASYFRSRVRNRNIWQMLCLYRIFDLFTISTELIVSAIFVVVSFLQYKNIVFLLKVLFSSILSAIQQNYLKSDGNSRYSYEFWAIFLMQIFQCKKAIFLDQTSMFPIKYSVTSIFSLSGANLASSRQNKQTINRKCNELMKTGNRIQCIEMINYGIVCLCIRIY